LLRLEVGVVLGVVAELGPEFEPLDAVLVSTAGDWDGLDEIAFAAALVAAAFCAATAAAATLIILSIEGVLPSEGVCE
jgi:hypothetical protein